MQDSKLNEQTRTLIYIATTFFVQFGNFVVIPLFWKKLSPSDYGVIAVTEIIGAVLTVIGSLSLEQSINRFYYQWQEADRRAKTGTVWALSWISITSNGLLALWLLPHVTPLLFPSVTFKPYILLGIIGSVLSSLTLVSFTIIRIERRAILYLMWSILVFATRIGTSAYLVIVLNRGLLGYFWANVFSGTFLAAASVPLMLSFATPNLAVRSVLPEIKYVIPIIPSSLVQSLATISDRYVLQAFASMETLGIYAVSLKFCGLVNGLHEALKLSYGPRLMKVVAEDYEGAKRFITSAVPGYVLPLFAMAGVVSIFVKPFVQLVGQPEYKDVVNVVPPLMIAAILGVLNIYYSPGMLIAQKTKFLVIPSTVALTTNVVGGALLTSYYQLPGLLGSKLVGGISLFLTNMWLSQRVFPLRHDWGTLLLTFCGTAAVAVAAMALPSPGSGSVGAGSWSLLAAYGVFVWSVYRKQGGSVEVSRLWSSAKLRRRHRRAARGVDETR